VPRVRVSLFFSFSLLPSPPPLPFPFLSLSLALSLSLSPALVSLPFLPSAISLSLRSILEAFRFLGISFLSLSLSRPLSLQFSYYIIYRVTPVVCMLRMNAMPFLMRHIVVAFILLRLGRIVLQSFARFAKRQPASLYVNFRFIYIEVAIARTLIRARAYSYSCCFRMTNETLFYPPSRPRIPSIHLSTHPSTRTSSLSLSLSLSPRIYTSLLLSSSTLRHSTRVRSS